jgi:hypothetical protein
MNVCVEVIKVNGVGVMNVTVVAYTEGSSFGHPPVFGNHVYNTVAAVGPKTGEQYWTFHPKTDF